MGKLGRIRQVLRRLGAHAGRPGARSRYLLLALTVAAIVAPMLGVGAARAWHANGVTVSVTCDRASGTYQVSATIEQSQESPGAFVKNIEPSSFPGDTSGEQTVTVTIGWDNS